MKTIKWSLFTLVFAVFMGAFISCSSDSNGDPAAKLSADPTHIDLSAGKDSKTVIITASEGKWNATRPEADSWCSLAAVDNKLTIAAEANGSDRERTTKVTVTSGNATPIVINVVQKSTILVGLPDTVILKVHGKEQAFTVLTEEKITLSTPDPAVWCTVIITYNNIAFSAPLNNGVRRETIANITAGGETKSVVVIQEAKGEGNYAIGDVYKVDGKAIGVVGWVNEYGNTFLVSLDEMADTETTFPAWTERYNSMMVELLTTEDDGARNMEIFRTHEKRNDFRAFKWCEAKNLNGAKDWFLPAKKELVGIYGAIDAFGLLKFNGILKANGGMPFSNADYWTSTQGSPSDYAWCVSFGNGTPVQQWKPESAGRAIRAVREL